MVLPLPFFCSAVTALMIAFLRLSPYLYIPLALLFIALLVYGLYSTSIFVFEMVDNLKDSQVKEAEDRLKVETSLDRMSMQFDSSLSLRRLSSRRQSGRQSSYTFGEKLTGLGVSVQRRFTKPRLSISGIDALDSNPQESLLTQDHEKELASSDYIAEEFNKGLDLPSELGSSNTLDKGIIPNPDDAKIFKPKGKISLQRVSSRRIKSKRLSKAKQKSKSSQILVEKVSGSASLQSDSVQGNVHETYPLNISNMILDSDSSSDDSHITSPSAGDQPTVVKVVRSKPKKLVRKSTSKKLKRGNTNRNLSKKQKSLSQDALSRGASGKIKMKSKSNSRAKLERQGTSRKWKNENQ